MQATPRVEEFNPQVRTVFSNAQCQQGLPTPCRALPAGNTTTGMFVNSMPPHDHGGKTLTTQFGQAPYRRSFGVCPSPGRSPVVHASNTTMSPAPVCRQMHAGSRIASPVTPNQTRNCKEEQPQTPPRCTRIQKTTFSTVKEEVEPLPCSSPPMTPTPNSPRSPLSRQTSRAWSMVSYKLTPAPAQPCSSTPSSAVIEVRRFEQTDEQWVVEV